MLQNISSKSNWWALNSKPLKIASVVLIVLVLGTTLIKNFYNRVDLKICIDAAQHLRDSRQVYNLSDALEHTKPPLATLLFVPFSFLNFSTLATLWNFFLLVAIVGTPILLLQKVESPYKLGIGILSILFCLNQLNVEVGVGQYNLISLILILLVNERFSLIKGMVFLALVLIKPTNILFFAYVKSQQSNSQVKKFLMGALVAGILLSAIYIFQFGLDSLLADHLIWLNFLPISTAKHISNLDNLGIPGILASRVDFYCYSNVILGLAFGGLIICSKYLRDKLLLLSISIFCILWLSPMTWPQNYCLLIVPIVWMLTELSRPNQYSRVLSCGLAIYYFLTQVLNYSLIGAGNYQFLREWRVQFIGSVVLLVSFAIYLFNRAKAPAPTQQSNLNIG